MLRNPLTASERRGILVVAALALLITGGGLMLSLCGRQSPELTATEVEILLHGDSVYVSRSDTVASGRVKVKRKYKKNPVRKKTERKIYHKRSPRDERVPLNTD